MLRSFALTSTFKAAFKIASPASIVSSRQFSVLTQTAIAPAMRPSFLGPLAPNAIPTASPFSGLWGGLTQKRFKARGNSYQPSTLLRKRRCGFLARMRSRTGRKIIERRREKGRYYLSH